MNAPARWDSETDVVVIGSGGSALTAAVLAADGGARVAVLERADAVGGTTAISGGIAWIPNNHHQAALGISDSREEALDYLRSLSLGVMDMALAEAFVDHGPAAVRYLEEHTPVRFHIAEGYPDYHPENPGGKPKGGRSLDPDLFSFRELGSWAGRVQDRGTDLHPQAPVVPVTLLESMERGMPGAAELRARAERDERALGQALVGALLKACLDREVPVSTGIRVRELVREADRVAGVRCEQAGRDVYIRAKKAVIIASGGFEWNRELVAAFLRGPLDGPASPPNNEGDGLLMAMDVGAALGNMSEAWWMPTFPIPGESIDGKPLFRICLSERTLPGSIIVNREGRRFVNEAANYNDIGRAFHTFDPMAFRFANVPAWLVFDDAYFAKYPVAGFRPGQELPGGMLHSAATLAELAASIGADGTGLEATVERFNEGAARGEDPDFGRGVSIYDSYNGDRSKEPPFTTLGPVAKAPFHAIALVPGALGTKGGPKTNARAQVLDVRGNVIAGLYAAGNAMAGATGMVYGGAGGTIGPGLTFGYIAGMNAARE